MLSVGKLIVLSNLTTFRVYGEHLKIWSRLANITARAAADIIISAMPSQ